MLINNNYTNSIVDNQINKFINYKFTNPSTDHSDRTTIPIFYKNETHNNSSTDEKILRDIISTNVKTINPNQKLIIYYKNIKTSNLVIKNSPPASTDHQQSNAVYKFKCDLPHRNEENNTYIGMTQCTVQRRLQQHINSGSILEHYKRKITGKYYNFS